MDNNTPDTREKLAICERLRKVRLRYAAWRKPRMFFRCSSCGSGPWHNSWAWIESGKDSQGRVIHMMPRKPVGACCSGAD